METFPCCNKEERARERVREDERDNIEGDLAVIASNPY
jgi:hypothetical protein